MITDLSYLENMTDGDAGLISEMIEIFSTQVREFSGLMKKHLDSGNWQELSKLAHKAKSSVAIMGMRGLAEKLKELEILAQDENEVQSFPRYIENYILTSEEAVSELQDYMTNLEKN